MVVVLKVEDRNLGVESMRGTLATATVAFRGFNGPLTLMQTQVDVSGGAEFQG